MVLSANIDLLGDAKIDVGPIVKRSFIFNVVLLNENRILNSIISKKWDV